jgi:dihydroorotate dehydrogenase electron transfer subunit
MIQLQASITDTRRVAPGVTLLHLSAPEIAGRAHAGQPVLARCSDGHDPYLRRPLPLFSITPPEIALLVRADEPGRRWLAHQPAGQSVDLLGPLGQGFTLTATTRHLLLVAEGMGVAALAALAAQAATEGIAVTLLAGAPSAATSLPADLLPTDVEYRLATADGSRGQRGSVASLLPSIIQWADQVCAAGSPALYHALAEAIGRCRLLVDDDFAQVWLLGTVACGQGACHCCTIETRHGVLLSCREGPVLRLKEVERW